MASCLFDRLPIYQAWPRRQMQSRLGLFAEDGKLFSPPARNAFNGKSNYLV
jgi:hypothetical protein